MKFLNFNKNNLIFIVLVSLILLAAIIKINESVTDLKDPTVKVITISKPEAKPTKIITIKNKLKFDKLVYALIQVESTGQDNITGDHHLGENYAAGALQIRPIMLKEVNRILKLQGKSKRYLLKDRFNRQKSIEMFHIWRKYHHIDSNFEKIVRSWNGGPKGYLRESTKHHWIKTQTILTQK